ncbi:hypothetical protein Acr_00g0091740 [Actinidia rufa]|uniref:Uncharacterized protein n=1 Tax=Actinidia rufa TaxID=165716 RepID=A0A7J0DZ32_9ERIC|nr:hypothetical protein Acr_00g0091740 [Actinidia rufa]
MLRLSCTTSDNASRCDSRLGRGNRGGNKMDRNLRRADTTEQARWSSAPELGANTISTLALLGQRSRSAIPTERAWRSFVPELEKVTTTDEFPPELSSSLPPEALLLSKRRIMTAGMAWVKPPPLTDTAGVEPRAKSSRFPKTAPTAVLTVAVLAGEASQVSCSGGQSNLRSRRTATSVYT